MSAIAFLRDLMADGVPLDAALIAADRFEQRAAAAEVARIAERREKDAARQQAKRERERHAESRGVTRTPTDSRGPLPHVGERSARVVTPFSSSLRSEEVVVVGAERERAEIPTSDDWPDGKATDHTRMIVEAVASPWLDPAKSPDLITTAGRFVAWRKAGASWEHDVVAVIRGLCANRRSRVASWKFFDDAIARSISENRAALAIPEAGSARATGPPGGGFMAQLEADRAEARRRVLNG